MKIWRYLLLSAFVLCFQAILVAQNNCYETQRAKGIQLYNQGDYYAAFKNFETAKLCTDAPANNDLDSWMDKCVIVVRLSVKKMIFDAVGEEEQCVEVSTNAKSFRVGNTPSWCKVSQQGRMLYVSCEDNIDIAPREAKINIVSGGKTAVLEVIQNSADLEMEFDPYPVVFSSVQETMMIGVTTNASDWAVETTPSWLVAERVDDTLKLACEKNTSATIRESAVVLLASGQPFQLQVRQMPGDTVIAMDRKELVVPQERTTEEIRVNSNMAGWKVTATEDWIEVSQKKDAVTVTVGENPTAFSRHGFVTTSVGSQSSEMVVHQKPHVTHFVMPSSELGSASGSNKDTVLVSSIPSDLRVYVDDSIVRVTPFTMDVDYEHHSLLMGLERREFLFNDMLPEVVFKPGLRFANITFTAPKNIGLRTGFVTANSFGAYCHFQASRPLVKEFVTDSIKPDGYHFMVGPVYQPLPYLGVYSGLGFGIYSGAAKAGLPRLNLDFELGVMGLYKNIMISMGLRRTQWSADGKRTTFVFGLGGYLKRYYDKDLGYCSSDSRRWWSVNYMTRPAQNGYGLMFADLGSEKTRTYVKAMYLQPDDSIRNFGGTVGLMFTPVDGIIDIAAGMGLDFTIKGPEKRNPHVEAEAGFIINLWRFPLTVMLHEADLFKDRHLYVDFGIGFHFGKFHESTYK